MHFVDGNQDIAAFVNNNVGTGTSLMRSGKRDYFRRDCKGKRVLF